MHIGIPQPDRMLIAGTVLPLQRLFTLHNYNLHKTAIHFHAWSEMNRATSRLLSHRLYKHAVLALLAQLLPI